jgi:hypothetical protein
MQNSDTSFTVSGFAKALYNQKSWPRWRRWSSNSTITLGLHSFVVGVTLLLNVIFTLWGVTHYPSSRGVGVIYQGDCALVKRLNLWIHLLINFLSTSMLLASNHCMQLQGSPTRKDIDQAHNSGQWLDIGVPSLRNLKWVGNWRRLSWLILCLSSLPVHLL